jgi:hypothetical protein
MTIPEIYQLLEGVSGEPTRECNFHGVKLQFNGMEPSIVKVNLLQPELAELTGFVSADKKHHPEEMLAILGDDDNPRLVVVKGSREIWVKEGPFGLYGLSEHTRDDDYIYVYRVDKEDGNILVEGTTNLRLFGEISGCKVDVSYYTPKSYREGEVIEITQKKKDWSIKVTEGELTHP